MSEKTKHILLGVAVAVLAADLIWRKRQHAKLGQVTATPAPAPAGYSVPPMNTAALVNAAGVPGFQSNINVNVNPDIAQFLTHNYIPLFGFVGMGNDTVH